MGNQDNIDSMICKYCGKQLPLDALYCGYCGKKIVVLKETSNQYEDRKKDFAVSEVDLETLISEEEHSHSAEIQNEIGGRFFSGEKGAKQDYNQAFKWLEKAAEQNHPLALYALSICYKHGYGIIKDSQKSIECLRKAADCNNAVACVQLAEIYELGRCVECSPKLAYYYYSKAAELGNLDAQEKLNNLLYVTDKEVSSNNNQSNLQESENPNNDSVKKDKKNLKCFVIYAYYKQYNEVRQCEILDNVTYTSEDLEAGIMYDAGANLADNKKYFCRIFCVKKESLYDFVSMTEEAIDKYGAEIYTDEDFFASYAFVDKYVKLFIFANDLTEAKEIYNSNYQKVACKFKILSVNTNAERELAEQKRIEHALVRIIIGSLLIIIGGVFAAFLCM